MNLSSNWSHRTYREGLDVTDAEETGVGRLVLGAHFGLDFSQRDEAMKEWLVRTRSNRGKLTLRRCKTALVQLLLENGCSGELESTDWVLDRFAATWHTQMFAGLAGGEFFPHVRRRRRRHGARGGAGSC